MGTLKIFSFTLFLCSIATFGQAQEGAIGYFNDALLFSRTHSIGTARTQAIGGAQVALGGDVNSAYANPAGLGFNRSSVVAITPSMNVYNSESSYFDTKTKDSKVNANFSTLGVIINFSKSDYEKGKFKGGSLAITVTRENNFHGDMKYATFNSQEFGKSSIIDSWLDKAWGVPIDQLGEMGIIYDAYNHYLISDYMENSAPNNIGYNKYLGVQSDGTDRYIGDYPWQEETMRTSGNQYQWDFAYGGNFDDKIYFGGSLSINTIKYKCETIYSESDFLFDGKTDEALNMVQVKNMLSVLGTGIGGTAGIIFRPSDIIRLGVSATTPTIYAMSEESSESLHTEFNNWEYVVSPDSSFQLNEFYNGYFTVSEYDLTTPWKITTGLAFFFGKTGFLSVDIDFVDYSQANLSSRDFETNADNKYIDRLYQNVVNFRAGGEMRVSAYRFRAGYAYEGDPYRQSDIDSSIRKISGGLGYRNKEFFVDISVVHSKYQTSRSPYTIYFFGQTPRDISPTAYTTNKNVNVAVTVGVNF